MKPLLILLTTFLCSNAYAQLKTITVSNPSEFERKDELIVLTRDFLQAKLGNVTKDQFIHIFHGNAPKVLQHDDLDKDGTWDEVVFLHDFSAGEKVVFTVQAARRPAAVKALVRAHVRHKRNVGNRFGENLEKDVMPHNNQPTDFTRQKLPPYLTEGPAWENDKVGFRKYFDVRNTNDIWGKTTSDMVLDYAGVDPEKSYHELDTWGMDILKVGKSLGAGGLALRIHINGKDSLVRLGTNAEVSYRRIADGPVRAMFEMAYKDFKYLPNAQPISITERISIWGGQFFYQNDVTISGNNSPVEITTGTIDLYLDKAANIITKKYAALYTHGKQSENKDTLGLGIVAPIQYFHSFGYASTQSRDIANTFTLNLSAASKKYTYRYYAAWEKTDKRFSDNNYFEKFLRTEAEKFCNKPVIE